MDAAQKCAILYGDAHYTIIAASTHRRAADAGAFQNGGAFLRSWPTQVGRFRPAASGRPPPSRSPQGDRWREAPTEPEFTRPVHHETNCPKIETHPADAQRNHGRQYDFVDKSSGIRYNAHELMF